MHQAILDVIFVILGSLEASYLEKENLYMEQFSAKTVEKQRTESAVLQRFENILSRLHRAVLYTNMPASRTISVL